MGNNKLKWSRFNYLSRSKQCLYNSYSNCLLQLNDSIYSELRHLSDSGVSNLSKDEIDFLIQNKGAK